MLYIRVQRLKTSLTKCQTRYCIEPRPSMDDCKVLRFLIARFAQQNALLLRTIDIRFGTKKKTPQEQNSSGKKIESVWCSGADRHSFEASAVPIIVYFYIVIIVHKYRQSAKERYILKRNTAQRFFCLRPEAKKRCLLKRDMPDARSEKKLTAGVSMIR